MTTIQARHASVRRVVAAGLVTLLAGAPGAAQSSDVVSATPTESAPDERLPQPGNDALEAQLAHVDRLLVKNKEWDADLAEALLREAREDDGSDSAWRFALLVRGIDVAVSCGELQTVQALLGTLERQFAVEGADLCAGRACRLARTDLVRQRASSVLTTLFALGTDWAASRPDLARRALVEAERLAEKDVGSPQGTPAALRRLREAIRAGRKRADALDVDQEHPLLPVPNEDDADRAAARQAIADTHAKFDTRSSHEQIRQAWDDLDRALDAGNPSAMRYEYFVAALRYAGMARDRQTLAQALDDLGATFDVDGRTRLGLLREASRRCYHDAQVHLYLALAQTVCWSDPDVAAEALAEAQAQRERLSGNPTLQNELARAHKAVETQCHLVVREIALRRTLAEHPDDHSAAEDLGWFLCTEREAWSEGLPLLARGRERWLDAKKAELVHTIAELELSDRHEPATIRRIADAWWGHAGSGRCTAAECHAILDHAATWYRRLTDLSGKDGLEVKSRIESAEKANAARMAQAARPVEARATKRRPGGPIGTAIDAGLAWLGRHQSRNGSWDADGFMTLDRDGEPCTGPGDPLHDIGVTALALLAFMDDGRDLDAATAAVVARGVAWLMAQQEESGRIGTDASHQFIYDHALAARALCVAFHGSGNRVQGDAARRAIDYLEAHRNRYGAWRYQAQSGDNDMSVTGCALAACAAAAEAGLRVEPMALRCAEACLEDMTDERGRTGYIVAGGSSARKDNEHAVAFPADRSEAMTAVALGSRFRLGGSARRSDIVATQADLLLEKLPAWQQDREGSSIDFYYWWHGTEAMRRVGGRRWTKWRDALTGAVLDQQRDDGNLRGSWDPVDAWGVDGGRVYATAVLVLALQECVR